MLWNMVLHILSVIEGYLLAVYTWPMVAKALGGEQGSELAAGLRGRLDAFMSGSFAAAVKAWFLRSATILWARLVALAGLLLAALDWLANLAGVPGVSENIRALLSPQYVPWYLIAIAIITELARRRTLDTGGSQKFLFAGQTGSGLPQTAPGKGMPERSSPATDAALPEASGA
jgi:hypothetical protein